MLILAAVVLAAALTPEQIRSANAGLLAPEPGGSSPTLADVTASLTQLQRALEIGVLRPQYAELLQQRLPVALAFTKNPPLELHPDAVAAVTQAIDSYQGALRSWSIAADYWRWAKQALELANNLAAEPPSRRETPDVRRLAVGETVAGRLGLGDAVAEGLTGGQYVDHFEVAIARGGRYSFFTEGAVCAPTPILSEAGGKPILKWDESYLPPGRTYKLKPGGYRLSVSCGLTLAPAVGNYKLSLEAKP